MPECCLVARCGLWVVPYSLFVLCFSLVRLDARGLPLFSTARFPSHGPTGVGIFSKVHGTFSHSMKYPFDSIPGVDSPDKTRCKVVKVDVELAIESQTS